jgi:hypothetical protein
VPARERAVWTLGRVVGDWITRHCVIPDGEHEGEPFELTAEMQAFLDGFYEVDARNGRFVYTRGGQLIRPQKWGKGPFSAALICAEAAGPVLPVCRGGKLIDARPWKTPWIQVTAVSEDQTGNVFRALLPMIELGPLSESLIVDTGLTRINLPGGGYIEPVTASARSRLGQRITFAVQDETHSWHQSNGGWSLADNQRRNLAGMKGRWLETTNAFDPVEQSVAQRTFEAQDQRVYKDDREPPPGSVRNKRERRKVLKHVYGDSWWVDLDRIDAEVEALLEHDPAQAERFFMNRKLASEGAAFDAQVFKALAVSSSIEDDAGERRPRVAKHSVITIGVDGARHDDALAIIATDVKTGHQWPLEIIERPPDADAEYEHDLARADGAMIEAFERFNVWRVYIDDQWIDHLVEMWMNRYGAKRVVVWPTYRPRNIAWAIREYQQAIAAGDLSHDGSETFIRHIANARRRVLNVRDDKERFMHTLSKDSVRSPRKIDAAMAAILSWKARSDALEHGIVALDDPRLDPEPEARTYAPNEAPPAEWFETSYEDAGPMGPMA